MAKKVIVKLTDDFDGSDAEETIYFGIDGKDYEIDLSKANAIAMRKTFQEYVDKGRSAASRSKKASLANSGSAITLFSKLDSEDKTRFRSWAKLPDARRISDNRVQEWIDAGRP